MARFLMLVFLLASGTFSICWHQANGYNADLSQELEEEAYLQGKDGARNDHLHLNDGNNANSDDDYDEDDGDGDDDYGEDNGDDDDDYDEDDGDDDDDDNGTLLEFGSDDDDDDDNDADVMLQALKMHATFQGHEGKKIKFDYSTDVDEQPLAYSSDEVPEESPHQQLENMRWVAVTADGYEYEGDLDEAKELMAEAMDEDDKDSEGIELGNEDDGDVPESDAHQQQKRRVFGYDSRRLITNTRTFPYSAMGRLNTGCTGTFISPTHVLTAAHCVFNRKTRRWYKNLSFRRGKACYPNWGRTHRWKHVVSVRGYTRYGLASYDYALITYRTSSPAWMSYGYTTRRRLRSGRVAITGYPGDKPRQCMWQSTCSVRRSGFFQFRRFFYRCDTARGMSGSAVFKYNRRYRRRVIYGIHAYGGFFYNSATRITRRRFRQFRSWIKKYT